jgi:hypothetical protein
MTIRTLTNLPKPATGGAQKHAPILSHTPWAGYGPADFRRAEALPKCPSFRCGREKKCVAAHQDLYCRRTHYSKAEYVKQKPADQSAAQLPRARDALDLDARRERLILQIEQRLEVQAELKARWKSGAVDHLYGKYRAGGVLLHPPDKIYV